MSLIGNTIGAIAGKPLETAADAYKDRNELKRHMATLEADAAARLHTERMKQLERFSKLELEEAAGTIEQRQWRPMMMRTIRRLWIATFVVMVSALAFDGWAAWYSAQPEHGSIQVNAAANLWNYWLSPLKWITLLAFGLYAPARTIEKMGLNGQGFKDAALRTVAEIVKGESAAPAKVRRADGTSITGNEPRMRPAPRPATLNPSKHPDVQEATDLYQNSQQADFDIGPPGYPPGADRH